MDTLTHALSAMLASRAASPKHVKPGELTLTARSWVGFFAGAFPDSDFIVMLFGTTSYLKYHRGITHSILMMPLWALLLAWLFSVLWRGHYSWRAFYSTCLLGVFVHIFGDVITSYGTMIFAPFSDYRLAFPTTFIIDWYFTGIIVVGLLFSYLSKSYKKQFAITGLGFLLCYVLAQAWWQRMARVEAYASIPGDIMAQAKVVVLPQPVSPFNWKIIIETPARYYVRYLNLFRQTPKSVSTADNIFQRADALYLPRADVNWELIPRFGVAPVQAIAQRIWLDPAMTDIRHFMEYPAVQQVDHFREFTCVWFADQRFVLRDLRAPFMFGGCESRDGKQRQILRLVDGKPRPLN
jgi:inner membrane protein